jgi:hypothetical protein
MNSLHRTPGGSEKKRHRNAYFCGVDGATPEAPGKTCKRVFLGWSLNPNYALENLLRSKTTSK